MTNSTGSTGSTPNTPAPAVSQPRHIDVAIALGQDLDDAAERFRAAYHPRVQAIVVAAGVVYAVSHTGRAHAVYVSSVPADVREQSADLGREMARLHAVPNSHGEQS